MVDLNPYQSPETMESAPPPSEGSPGGIVNRTLLKTLGVLILLISGMLLVVDGITLASNVAGARAEQWPQNYVASMVICAIGLVIHFVTFSSAQELVRLRSYRAAWYAGILCCLPCVSALSCLGLPIGAVTLIVLRQPAAKALFSQS